MNDPNDNMTLHIIGELHWVWSRRSCLPERLSGRSGKGRGRGSRRCSLACKNPQEEPDVGLSETEQAWLDWDRVIRLFRVHQLLARQKCCSSEFSSCWAASPYQESETAITVPKTRMHANQHNSAKQSSEAELWKRHRSQQRQVFEPRS